MAIEDTGNLSRGVSVGKGHKHSHGLLVSIA